MTRTAITPSHPSQLLVAVGTALADWFTASFCSSYAGDSAYRMLITSAASSRWQLARNDRSWLSALHQHVSRRVRTASRASAHRVAQFTVDALLRFPSSPSTAR